MNVQKINNHVQQALQRLLAQYADKPRIIGIITALVKQVQDIEDAAFATASGTMLYDGTNYPAMGVQLDGIGEIVGIGRSGASDAQYLLLILGKIAENFSDGTIPVIETIAQLVFNCNDVTLTELFPAEVAVEVGDPQIDPSLGGLASQMIAGSLGAGIDLAFVASYETGDAFEFTTIDAPSNVDGFDDLNSPGAGGILATLIYPIAT